MGWGRQSRLPEVIAEVERVRGGLGQAIVVTPFPQMGKLRSWIALCSRKRADFLSATPVLV